MPSVAFQIETNLLTWTANQMTGLYMKCNTGLKWVKAISSQCYTHIEANQKGD